MAQIFHRCKCYNLDFGCSKLTCDLCVTQINLGPFTEFSVYRDECLIYNIETFGSDECFTDLCLKIYRSDKIIIDHLKWDYIILGLGTAGSILAYLLSNDKKTRVLVIEKGTNNQDNPIVENPNWLEVFKTLIFNPKYATPYIIEYPQNSFSALPYEDAGFLWGGASAHNFLVAVRGTEDIYDTWAVVSGEDSWSYSNLEPKMKLVETFNGISQDPSERGENGPIIDTQSPQLVQSPTYDNILYTFSSVTDTPFIEDYNVGNAQIGISASQQFITLPQHDPLSQRSYANKALLLVPKVVDINGIGTNGRKLKILSGATVTKIQFNGTTAIGVRYVLLGCNKVAYLSKGGEVISCLGAIQSPKILTLSGIGPQSVLSDLNITPVVYSENVGKNFKTQYGTNVQGISLSSTSPQTSIIFTSIYGDNVRRVENQIFNTGSIFVDAPFIVNPKTSGSINIVSNDYNVSPQILFVPYSDDPSGGHGSDLDLIVQTFLQFGQVAYETGATLIFPPQEDFPAPYGPQADNSKLKQDATHIQYLTLQAHSSSTCRMATSINEGVVDGQLRVFGVNNLRVCDTSIFPLIPNGNTCFPAYYTAVNLAYLLGVPIDFNV